MIDSRVPIQVAAAAVGVSRMTGYRWRDARDGIVRGPLIRGSAGRALTMAEREEVALGLMLGLSHAEIGQRIGRDRSVVWREIERNSNVDGSYRAVSAQQRANASARRPKPAKLAVPGPLRDAVVAKFAPEVVTSADLDVAGADLPGPTGDAGVARDDLSSDLCPGPG